MTEADTAEHIPVLDMAEPTFHDELVRACETSGFFALVNHGIDERFFIEIRAEIARSR